MTDEIKPHSITLCKSCGIVLHSCRCPEPHTIKRDVCCSCKSNSAESWLTDVELGRKHPELNLLVEESSSGPSVEAELRKSLADAEAEQDVARHSANESGNLLNECGVAAGMRAGDDAKDIPGKVRARITFLEEKLEKAAGLLANGAAERKEHEDEGRKLNLVVQGFLGGMAAIGWLNTDRPLHQRLDSALGFMLDLAKKEDEKNDRLETRVTNLQQKLGAAVEGYEEKS